VDAAVPSGAQAYDYGAQWKALLRRMGATEDLDELGRGLTHDLAHAAGASSVALYLLDAGNLVYHLAASLGDDHFAAVLDKAASLPCSLRHHVSAVPLQDDLGASGASKPENGLAVAIRLRTALLGFIVLGPRRSAEPYTADDVEFLTTVATHMAFAVTTLRGPDGHRGALSLDPSAMKAGIIHDIKNAVATLSLLARNAAHSLTDPEFQREALSSLSATVERMRRLLGKLAAPDTALAAAEGEPIDLRELIIQATRPLAVHGRVRLVRALQPVKAVYGDLEALRRVVETLTTNAAEAIEHEGTVTVTLAEEHGHAVISVADTGRGIPRTFREHHLFAPFRSTKQGGWGIGLYQARQAIERQAGQIFVESVEGQGTIFTVKLPLQQAMA
jgi:signal transduction histidine kinase